MLWKERQRARNSSLDFFFFTNKVIVPLVAYILFRERQVIYKIGDQLCLPHFNTKVDPHYNDKIPTYVES